MAKILSNVRVTVKTTWALLILGSIFVWAFGSRLYGQCATCKAAAATEDEAGELIIGGGLNTGILYLLAMPFVISAVIGLIWYRNKKKLRELSS